MANNYAIYPAVGVARVGNSLDKVGKTIGFYLAPDEIGGLPKDCDPFGNETGGDFSGFKDTFGKIKRQAQKFRVYLEGTETEIKIGSTIEEGTVESIEWTVHLANKKSEWYNFSEQKGNLLFGTANSYQSQEVEQRNSKTIPADPENGIPEDIEPPTDRHELFIDPGPRTISGANQEIAISRDNIPPNYTRGHFPPKKDDIGAEFQGRQIDKLGDLKTDSEGRLLVLGGLGRSQGQIPLDSYGGADTWYDDISDGSVTCTINLDQGDPIEVTGKAWVIVGPPDFAPELVNITSWDDTMFDVGVRYKNLVPDMYDKNLYLEYGGFNPNFRANYERDILPIIKRISGYQWVANVQSMSAFFSNIFDFSDNSAANFENRRQYFSYFRRPEPQKVIDSDTPPEGGYPSSQYEVFSRENEPKIPLMPLNSGSNSVSNYNIKKFMALTQTQYFLLQQWSIGRFDSTPGSTPSYPGVDPRNSASVGNVVGLPQCPGIEVTWTTQNPAIYEDDDAYQIKHYKDSAYYYANGLTPTRDECEAGDGCEPGDLTKRMAIPWQADFFNCTIQLVNFNDPDTNKVTDGQGGMTPMPPTYYSYWWPPQAPWDVLGGDETAEAQKLSGISAGLQVNYMRGVNSYGQMVNDGWSYLAFIRNQNANASNEQKYPYFVETERNHDMFECEDVEIKTITGRDDDAETSIKVFYLKDIKGQQETRASKMRALNLEFVEDLLAEIKIAESHRRRAPRSGTRVRF